MPDGAGLRGPPILNLPNVISFARLCAVPLAVWLVLRHQFWAAFGVVSSVCRGLLSYSRSSMRDLADQSGLTLRGLRLHGYLYENRSPTAAIPIARKLEDTLPGGAYILMAATP